MTKVLFVCLGNICRSPMAEGLLQKRVQKTKQAAEFLIDSAATSSYEIGLHRIQERKESLTKKRLIQVI